MSKKDKRTPAEKAAHLERAIRKFGDPEGKLQKELDKLRGKK